MPASTTTATLGLQWTPPGAAPNSGVMQIPVAATCRAQNVGEIDINPSDTPSTVIAIPFGTVNSAKVFIFKNGGTQELGIRLNSAVADNVKLPAGGVFMYAAPTAPGATPLTAVSVVVVTSPIQIDQAQYYVYGD